MGHRDPRCTQGELRNHLKRNAPLPICPRSTPRDNASEDDFALRACGRIRAARPYLWRNVMDASHPRQRNRHPHATHVRQINGRRNRNAPADRLACDLTVFSVRMRPQGVCANTPNTHASAQIANASAPKAHANAKSACERQKLANGPHGSKPQRRASDQRDPRIGTNNPFACHGSCEMRWDRAG